jgi:hypothetical protein
VALILRCISILLCATLMAGCAQGPLTPAAGSPGGAVGDSRAAEHSSSHRSRLTVRIRVPRSKRLGAKFVSAATKSISIVVSPGTAGEQTFNQNVSPGVNTFSIQMEAGTYVGSFETWDGALDASNNPTGKVLSANDFFSFTIVRGTSNLVGVTLQGVPKGIAIVPSAGQDITGDIANGFNFIGAFKADGVTPFTRSLTAVATDADGNYILGAGAPVVTATSANTAVLSNGVPHSGNRNLFSVTPATGGAYPQQATMTFVATPVASSGASPVTATVIVRIPYRNAPRLYALIGNSTVLAYDESGNSVAIAGFGTLGGQSGTAITYDSTLNSIDIASGNGLYRFSTSGTQLGASVGTAEIIGLTYSAGTAQLYTSSFAAALAVYKAGNLSAVATGNWNEENTGTPPGYPIGVVADNANGEIYVMDAGAGSGKVVQPYTTGGVAVSGTQFFPSVPGSGFLTGMAQDPSSGYLYITNSLPGVQVFDESGTEVAIPAGSFAGLTGAEMETWDATSSRLYVYDNRLVPTIVAFDANGNSIATPGGFPGIGQNLGPLGIVSVP